MARSASSSPFYLTELGLDARGLGLAVTLALLSSAALTVAVRRPAQRWGPRTALLGLAALSVVAALLFLTARLRGWWCVAAMLGNLAVGTGESGPFLALEQVAVTRASARARGSRAR